MNFFKKVISFFSIIWNAILWRRTVKDKKSKSVDKRATGRNVSGETERLAVEEEAEKGFVNVPLDTPGSLVNPYTAVSDINLQDSIIPDTTGLAIPIIVPSLDFAGLDTELLTSDGDVTGSKLISSLQELNNPFEREGELMPPDEGLKVPKREDLPLEKDSKDNFVSDDTDLLCSENVPIVETAILQPPLLVELLEANEDENEDEAKEEEATKSIHKLNIFAPCQLEDEQTSEKDIVITERSEPSTPSSNVTNDRFSPPTEHDELQQLIDQQLCQGSSIVAEYEDKEVEEVIKAFDKVVSSDGDYALPEETSMQEKLMETNCEEIYSDNVIETIIDDGGYDYEPFRVNFDTPAIVVEDGITRTVDDSSVALPTTHDDGKTTAELEEVQTSISSLKLTCSSKFGDGATSDHSTNYMVRSESLVNFLPTNCDQDGSESVPFSPERISDGWMENHNCAATDPTKTADIDNSEQSCLEEIMCTPTGILKLSDYGCDDSKKLDDTPIQQEDGLNLEDEVNDESLKLGKDPQSKLFRYGGIFPEFGNATDFIPEGTAGPSNRYCIVNFQNETHKPDPKESGHKSFAKDESNEHSSTKSENDTLDNIDELSYDIHINNNHGEAFQNSSNSSSRRELEMDPALLRRIRSVVPDESIRTVSNIPSLPNSETHYQLHGSDHLKVNTKTGGSSQERRNNRERKCEVIPFLSSQVSAPSLDFPEQLIPSSIPAEYDATHNTPFDVNTVSFDEMLPLMTEDMTNYYEMPKWQQSVSHTPSSPVSALDFNATGFRFASKNQSLLYTGPDKSTLENYSSKKSHEFYPFIDGTSYLFGIPEEIRKEEHFNPCVGAAPSSRGMKSLENSKSETIKVMEGHKLEEPTEFEREQNWSMAQRPPPQELCSFAESVEPKFADCYRLGVKLQVDGENWQSNVPQYGVWNASDQMLPVGIGTPFPNECDTNEPYPQSLDHTQHLQGNVLTVDYLQNAGYDEGRHVDCNLANNYEFVNPYGVGVFPMLNLPFCLPDPSILARGQIPPFIFPVGQTNVDQIRSVPDNLEDNNLSSSYPPTPYWAGFELDDNGQRVQTDDFIKHEMISADINENYGTQQVSVTEMAHDDDPADECPMPDQYFTLAENSSCHSIKSKADSFNGSLFCESLRSILSSHNMESDQAIPSFSCSSVRCYNPSLVVRSCETSLSNDSLPSIIVEGIYSKSVDDDYPAKEKFMNDVNTALNESMIDQMQRDLNGSPESFLERGDYDNEIMETDDNMHDDIERTLQGIMEATDSLEYPEEVQDNCEIKEVVSEILKSVLLNVLNSAAARVSGGNENNDNDEVVKCKVDVTLLRKEDIIEQHVVKSNAECGDGKLTLVLDDAKRSSDPKHVAKQGGFVSIGAFDDQHPECNNQFQEGVSNYIRGDVGELVDERPVSNIVPSSNGPNTRRRNRRRKTKDSDTTGASEKPIAPEIAIGDGSIEIKGERKNQENSSNIVEEYSHQGVSRLEPTAMEGPDDAQADEDDIQSREDRDGDHKEHDSSLGNSSNNRKRRNRRKKRKN